MSILFQMDLKEMFIYLALTVGTSSLAYQVWLSVNKLIVNRHWKNNSNKKKVYINGMSCCFPKNVYSQNKMREMFIKNYCGGEKNLIEEDLNFINRVFNASLIEKSHVNLNENDLFRRMKREEYTEYVKQTILSMSVEATINAIKDSNQFNINEITHLIFGTMTGTIAAPSMDIFISKEVGLNQNVRRLNVESMGCLTGFRLVGLCRDISLQSENNLILLIVSDIRSSLGNQLTIFNPNKSIDKSNVIISALFRDSCGAALFSQKKAIKKSCFIIDHRSTIIENTLQLGRLKEFNDSTIHLYLDKQLPYAVFNYIPNFINEFLQEHQINICQCQFAVHTGGPKIIRGIQECLNLRDEQLCVSWFVMINYGNLSGSSNLVVLEHLRRWISFKDKPVHKNIIFPKDFNQYKYIIGLSFGPGIAIECVLLQIE